MVRLVNEDKAARVIDRVERLSTPIPFWDTSPNVAKLPNSNGQAVVQKQPFDRAHAVCHADDIRKLIPELGNEELWLILNQGKQLVHVKLRDSVVVGSVLLSCHWLLVSAVVLKNAGNDTVVSSEVWRKEGVIEKSSRG